LIFTRQGVFQLAELEKELVHEQFTVDTRDHEDHTFCGVMFDCHCETNLPGARDPNRDSLSADPHPCPQPTP
jgi:hypothetical protein